MKDLLAGYEVDEEFLRDRQVKPQERKSNTASSAMPLEQAIRAHADLFGGLEKLHEAIERFDEKAFQDLAGKAGISGVSRVEVLPFHQMGRDKWEALGRTYELADTPPPTPESTERVRAQFRAHGLVTY